MTHIHTIETPEDTARERNPGMFKKGCEQTPAMNFATRLSWLQKRLSGLHCISDSSREIIRHPFADKLSVSDFQRMQNLLNEVGRLETTAMQLAAEIADFNRTKKLRKV